jgi:hypothetical protein
MRRLTVAAGFVIGAVLALGAGIGVTVFAGLNPTWVTLQVPVLDGFGQALEQGSAVRGRPLEGQLWFLMVSAFVAGILFMAALALVMWAVGLGNRLRERRHIRELEEEVEDLRDLATARLAGGAGGGPAFRPQPAAVAGHAAVPPPPRPPAAPPEALGLPATLARRGG